MPKKLNISSNERVDLTDFNRASAEYTQESDSFEREKLIQARRSLVASGFRIEISDQTTAPGEFTIYNGLSLDRSGNILNNEQQITDARTMTLSGAGTTFYIEIEFVEGESDVDNRAFWDPTFAGNTPPGKEFSLNVATRVTPDWQVAPVSTSGFAVDITDVNSVKIPISVLVTNVNNEIVHTAVNASSVLEEDLVGGVTDIRVLDSTLFPGIGDATLGFGGPNAEPVSITSNDRANGIITVASTSNSHNAGAILRETVVPASFIPEGKFAAPTGSASDSRRRLYAGDAERGGALAQDSQDYDARSDLAIKSLKDHVDFLAAQIREMKYGTTRLGETTTPAITVGSASRYYDYAGSISAVRSFAFTIGDNVLSGGDYTSASDDLGTIIQEAHDALDATNGGAILVREGNYVWDATVAVDRPLSLVFADGVVFDAGTYATSPISIEAAVRVEVVGMPAVPVAELPFPVTCTDIDGFDFIADTCTLQIDFTGAITAVAASSMKVTDCVLPATNSSGAVKTDTTNTTATFASMVFTNCQLKHDAATDLTTEAIVEANLGNAIFSNCIFDLAVAAGSATQYINSPETFGPIRFTDCTFIETGTGKAKNAINFDATAQIDPEIYFTRCYFEVTWAATTASLQEKSFVSVTDLSATIWFQSCIFKDFEVPDSAISSASLGNCIYLDAGASTVHAVDCEFLAANPLSYETAIYIDAQGTAHINDCLFNGFHVSLRLETNRAYVTGCYFNTYVDNAANVSNTGIYMESSLGQAFLTCNTFKHTQTSSVISSYLYTGIDWRPISYLYTPIVISDNIFIGEIWNGEAVFIDLPPFVLSPIEQGAKAQVTGNIITVPLNVNNNQGDIYGIKMDTIPGNTNDARVNISNNNISISMNTTATNDIYGIWIELDSDPPDITSYDSSGSIISNNNIAMHGGDTGDTVGIQVYGSQVSISDNNVTLDGSVTGAPASKAIWGDGHFISIVNNNVINNGTATTLVRIDVGPDGSGAIGGCSIDNNTINNEGGLASCILMATATPNTTSLSISGNKIRQIYEGTSNIIDFNGSASSGRGQGLVVNNNVIWEATAATSSTRSAIDIFVSNVGWDGIVVNGNAITSGNANLRATNGGAISIVGSAGDIKGCSVVGNCVSGWAAAGSANRGSIYVSLVDRIICNSNSTEYSGVGGEASVRVLNCPSGNVSANETNGTGVAITGSTVTVNGDNA